MSSSKFLKTARQVIKEHSGVFEALLEYERTKKLPKTVYRERINLTINADLLRKFKRYCREHGFNMSRLVEKYIKKELNLKSP